MTNMQILTLAIAIIFPLGVLLYSDARSKKGIAQTEMALGFERLTGAIKALDTNTQASIKALETKLTIHELEHHQK
jgi:hypothetical protein